MLRASRLSSTEALGPAWSTCIAALVVGLTLSGCKLGTGDGAVAGAVYLAQCVDTQPLGAPDAPAAFDLNPQFYAADQVFDLPRPEPNNRVSIRVQSGGNLIDEANALLVNIASERLLLPLVGQSIRVGPDTNIRATLSLQRMCPQHTVQMELDGTVTFSTFGHGSASSSPDYHVTYGDQLKAEFDFVVVDRRAIALSGAGEVPLTPAAAGHLSGFFDFIIRQGRAAQAYP